jgi:radical SAM superfamily enzyme YgiQ (UPF0313 family)
MYEKNGIPMFGIESKREAKDFDILGTSVSYPVLAVNFIKQLQMSGIPPSWDDLEIDGSVRGGRKRNPEKWPFIIVGGQGYGAPEVLANIADAVFCGEAEDEPGQPGIGTVLERVEAFKDEGLWSTDREECYRRLAIEFNFLYFPRFIDVHYAYEDRPGVQALLDAEGRTAKPSKQVSGYTSLLPGMRVPFVKRFVRDMDAVEGLTNPPLLYIEPGMGAADLEAGRGCPAWCGFCALTYRQKPYRQRSVETMTKMGADLIENTGALHLAPFSPDFPMHTQKKKLLGSLMEHVTDEIDASSMRVDDFLADGQYITLQAYAGMDSVTLGVEGNSQRMRDLVGKGAADEDIKEAVARGIRAGIKKFKLYMIASLPGEDKGDIDRVLNLAKELADIRDSMSSTARIQFSWTPMLIEGNTPFQWFSPTAANSALGDVWESLRDIRIDFRMGGKGQKDKFNFFQLTQRASREIGKAMVEAVAEMNTACWGGAPKGLYEKIRERLIAHGFHNDYADAYDERDKRDMFGWEFVDQGINVELMWVTFQQMREFLENTDSETYDEQFGDEYHGNEWIERCDTKCYGKTCGVCSAPDLKIRRNYIQAAADEIHVDLTDQKVIDQRTVATRVRAKIEKFDEKRFVMNDHHVYAIRRAANKVGLPITKRTIKFASDSIRFRDWTSGVDFVEFGLLHKIPRAELDEKLRAMNTHLNTLEFQDWTLRPASAESMRQEVDLSLYEIELDEDPAKVQAHIDRFFATDYVKMIFKFVPRFGDAKQEEVNGRDYVDDLWVTNDGHRLLLKMLVRGKASPFVVYSALFNRPSSVEAAKYPAHRVEAFVEQDTTAYEFWNPVCEGCGHNIPLNLMSQPFHDTYCPRCLDSAKVSV